MKRLLVGLTILLMTASASAQISTEGSVRGQVKDEQGAVLPGVSMTATSPTVAGIFSATSDAEGRYRLLNLPPGSYTLRAELAGFSKSSRPNIVIRAGLNLVVDVALRLGELQETVQVTAESPLLETQKAVQAVNISGEFQRQLPLGSRRDFSEFLELVPGVTARGFDQATGGQVYMLRGSEIENHVVQIDGADVGSFRQGWASLYVNFNTDAIEDTQVKTGGGDASQPLGVGLVINVATQSGTNTIRGSAGAIYQARSWNGNNNPSGTSGVFDIVQPDLSLGGPIKKDRAFFFAAYRYTRRNTGIARTPLQLGRLQGLVPDFQEFDNRSRNSYYYVKGTLQLSPSHQLYAFYQRDLNPEDGDGPTNSRNYAITAFGGQAVGARLSSIWGSSVTTKVLAAWNDKSINGDFSVFKGRDYDDRVINVFDSVNAQQGRLNGVGFLVRQGGAGTLTAQPAEKLSIQGDLTYYKSGWLGSHEFQTGVFLQPRLGLDSTTRYLNNGFTQENFVLRRAGDLNSGYVPFHRVRIDEREFLTRSIAAKDYGFYVQDAWKPTSRSTINAGVRIDYVEARDRIFDVLTQANVEVGPRFGVTYAITSDQKNIFRASASRVHDFPQNGYLESAGTSRVGQVDEYDLNLDGIFETSFPTPRSTAVSTNREIDPSKGQPFVDEYIIGYRRQFPRQVGLDVSWVRRYYKHMPASIEVNGIYDGGVFSGYRNEDFNNIFLVTNDRWATPVYSGLEFTGTTRQKNLQIIVGYTRQWQHLDGTWRPNDPASFIQPDQFANNRGIGSIRGNDTNSLSGTSMTRSPSWQKHALRIGGSYLAPWSFLVGTNFSLQSGPYSGPVLDLLPADDPRFGPPTVRLSNGRVVSNPLATRIRFAFNNRGEGQIKAPNLIVWNLRVGRDFRFGDQRFEVAFDTFNVTNRGAAQQFMGGGNQRYSPNYAIGPDGNFRGTSLQFARSGQLLLRWVF